MSEATPRTRVAMRMLGVSAHDLQPGAAKVAACASSFQGSAKAKQELIETLDQKRAEILEAVAAR